MDKDLCTIRKGEERMDISEAAENVFYSLAAERVVHRLALLASLRSILEMQTLRQYPSSTGSESEF